MISATKYCENTALTLVDGLEAGLFAIVKTRAEFDLWNRAAPEVSNNSSWCWGGTG